SMDVGGTWRDCWTSGQAHAGRLSFSCLLPGVFPCGILSGFLFPGTLLYLRSSSGFAVCWSCHYRGVGPGSQAQQPRSVCAAPFILRGTRPTDSCRKRVLL